MPDTPSWDSTASTYTTNGHISVIEEKELIEQAYPIIEPKINSWRYCNGQEKTISALLVTLPSVLWENNSWKPIDITSLNDFQSIKKTYKRALLTIHPDKVTQSPIIVRATAERIFQVLSSAFYKYEQNQNAGRAQGRRSLIKR